MAIIWLYFTFSEMLTGYFGGEPHELKILWSKLTGEYAFWFWLMFLVNFILPLIILSFKKLRTIKGIFIASCGILVGMWIERQLIVIPTLSHSIFIQGTYHPALVEIMLFIGAGAAFFLLYMMFSKFLPLISVWEIQEGREEAVEYVSIKVNNYQPAPGSETLKGLDDENPSFTTLKKAAGL
jgi:molybdopterin-containing oxidoreductase family membrane subunit